MMFVILLLLLNDTQIERLWPWLVALFVVEVAALILRSAILYLDLRHR